MRIQTLKKTINTTASINKKKNEELVRNQQRLRLILLVLLVIAIVSVTAVDIVIVLQRRSSRAGAEEALFPAEYASTGAALPDDPSFVFYNRKKDRIETENIPQLPGLVSDVDDANVIVSFRTDSEYVDTVETDDGPMTLYDQTLQIAVVRKKGWSLIDEASFTYRLDVDKVGEALLRDEAVEYLTDILG